MALTATPSVRVLCDGYLVREEGVVVDASSTVTLVCSRGRIVVIDTGARSNIAALRKALTNAHVGESEIDVVVNTHLHSDHCGGNDIFSDAVQLAHRLENPPVWTVKAEEDDEIAPGVHVRYTPGHTAGSVSVLVESDMRYAICGDAIPTKANYVTGTPPAIHVDRRLAVESMSLLTEWADVIIPGHDAPFETVRKR